ncbi:uncharacterized protein B0T15DRAFT_508710 [Chaetomium strumarium]|uniref:Uncharacterized protein n=1 Tax=Chaetomium strumarium TaxID=1170767 RepID=A0AAJ0GY23_9PEZI|nr:hypothetical protein B0T15DRAFT_508710 [Chaetomium strumarium]
MFEVDWADYESERVGERRARKEVERTLKKEKEKENANNGQLTTSTRSSCPSERSHLSFFGSIGRKKAIANPHKSKKEEAAITESTKADARTEQSMLSKMTQLTIPTQGEGSVAETAFATTRLVQVHEEASPFSAKPPGGISRHGWVILPPPTRTGDAPSITASPRTPRAHRPPPSFQSPTSLDGKSASEFIDDWFTALRRPTYQLPRSERHGTIRRGHVLLPPNLHRAPATPTRHSVKKDFSMTPKASPIRFLAHDPDDWKPVAEWDRMHSASAHVPSSTNHETRPHENTKAPNTMTVDMEAMRIHEAAIKGDNTSTRNSEYPCAPEGQIAPDSHGPVHQESGVLAECASSKATAV